MSKICPKSGSQINDSHELNCNHNKNPLKNITNREILKKFWNFIVWIFEHLYIPIAILIIGVLIINPPLLPLLPDIYYTVAYNTGTPVKKIDTSFKLDLQADKNPWIMISAFNNGRNFADDFDVEFKLLKSNKIIKVERKYLPTSLERKVDTSEIKKIHFMKN
jgi:hypothetical protein